MTADTSAQPDGFTRRVLLNVLEAFFRRPILHLLPLVLMLVIGVASVVGTSKQYVSSGTMSVTNESLLEDLTAGSSGGGFTLESVASSTARQLNELLGTDQFIDEVVKQAGIQDLLEQKLLTREQVRSYVGARADGDNIVRVGSSTTTPELSMRLAEAAMSAYTDWVVASDVSQSTTTETALTARVQEKQAAATAADQALTDKINEDPTVPIDERSPAQQLEYARLLDVANRAQTQLEQAQDALDAAKLQTAQASEVVAQRLQVLDSPTLPVAPTGGLKQSAMSMVLFFLIGVVLSVASVIISSTLDRTVRVPDDISRRYGVDVLAVVPNIAR